MGLQVNLLMIQFLLMRSPLSTESKTEHTHKIQPLENNPGLYFERMQDVFFTETDWKVIIFIDLAPLHYNATYFHNALTDIRTRCRKIQEHPALCEGLVERTYMLKEINRRVQVHYEELLDTMNEVEPIDYSTPPSPKTIKRSAPFGFIGSVSKTLFGTLSESDGQEYNKQIKELFKGQINLAKIGNKEAHLVEHQLAHMNEQVMATRVAINKTMGSFISAMKEWNQIQGIWHQMGATKAITEITNSIETTIILYQDIFRSLTQAVHAARLGHLHPSLLSTARLQQVIRQITDLRPSYEFPIPIAHARADKLAEIVSVRLGFKQNKFLIEVSIPLLNKFPTELYKIHSVPILQFHDQKTISAYIKPQTPYIAVTNDKRAYSLLTKENLEACAHTPFYRICTHTQPIYESDKGSACEYLLLNQPSTNNLKKCNVHFLPKVSPYWIYLDSINGWLYSVAPNTTLQVLCPGEQHILSTISGVGLLQLRPKCSARHDRVMFAGIQTLGYSTEFVYLPNVHLDIKLLDNDFFSKLIKINDSLLYPLLVGKTTPNQLDSGLTLKSVQDKYEDFISETSDKTFQSSMIYGAVGSNIVIILAYVEEEETHNDENPNN